MRGNLKNLSKVELLRIIKRLKAKERSHIIKFLDKDAIDIVGECIHNVLFENCNLKNKTKIDLRRKFKSKEKQLRILADRRKPFQKRKSVLIQEGGSIGAILGIALPLLTNLLFGRK